jgi:hypothetical protein
MIDMVFLKEMGAFSRCTYGSYFTAFRCKSSLRFAPLQAFRFNPSARGQMEF